MHKYRRVGISGDKKRMAPKIKIQIKSSKTGADNYLKKHSHDVAVIIVKAGDDSDLLRRKIISAVSPLREKYKKKREKH